jgi:hypothetical protein
MAKGDGLTNSARVGHEMVCLPLYRAELKYLTTYPPRKIGYATIEY